jgi:hypothetical protein
MVADAIRASIKELFSESKQGLPGITEQSIQGHEEQNNATERVAWNYRPGIRMRHPICIAKDKMK